ncbi:MAG: dihydrofolate reductase [Spirochaetales bacterium]|nr:dihydrofolate reductase [Leptospiraceae bacterium]MCP5483823.1 dihydrofolate reductase [Spirochaetales bacterium]
MQQTKVRYYTATTLDGFLADEQHSLEWLFEVKREEESSDFMTSLGAFVMGRNTFDWIVQHEKLGEHPEKWREWHGDLPCWVFTNRELVIPAGANIKPVQGPVKPVYEAMVAAAQGKDIWMAGGGELAARFADEGLLDELTLHIAPVTLGKGAPLLPRRILSSRLQLIDVRQNGQFIDARYRLSPPP